MSVTEWHKLGIELKEGSASNSYVATSELSPTSLEFP